MADIQDYFSRRVALIQEDRSLRRENDLLLSLTANESAADKIVRRIRAKEEVSVWGVEHDEVPHIFPGMEFLMCICPHLRLYLPELTDFQRRA
jgi:adenosine deaminase CECR1